jgi:hypothetical protein
MATGPQRWSDFSGVFDLRDRFAEPLHYRSLAGIIWPNRGPLLTLAQMGLPATA